MALELSYSAGIIREVPSGRLVAWFDGINGILLINGESEPIRVADLERALEIVVEHFEEAA